MTHTPLLRQNLHFNIRNIDSYDIDDQISDPMLKLITNAQKNGEVQSTRSPLDLLTTSYTVVRGVNIHWCFQWAAYDLIEKARHEMDVLFCPNPGFELK